MSDSNRDTNYSRPPMNTNLRDPNLGLCEPTALLIPAPIGQQAIYAARVQNATALTAQRNPVPLRMDLLVPEFLEDMARIMAIGAEKYGELNWQNGGLTGNKSGLNHALMHLMEYMRGTPNEYGEPELHLAQVAVNCMFESWYSKKAKEVPK